MKTLRAMFARFAGLFHRHSQESEMNEELQAHLDALTDRNIAAGMSPNEARYAALRTFGGVAQIAERARDERRSVWGEHLLQDLRYAFRALRKSPAFTAVAVVSLAIGIGANIAMFGWFAEMVLRPLPVPQPHELVLLGWHRTVPDGRPVRGDGGEMDPGDMDAASGQPARRVFAWPTFQRLRATSAPHAELLAMAPLWHPNLTIDSLPERLETGNLVSGNFHAVLRVKAAVGRTLKPEDDQPGAAPVVVISHRYWQRRFAGDPAVVGKNILLNRTPVTIVGVTEAGFEDVLAGRSVSITAPLALTEQIFPEADEMPMRDHGHWWVRIMGRLKPGVSSQQLVAELAGVFREEASLGWNKPSDLPRLFASSGAFGRSEKARRSHVGGLLPLVIMVGLLLVVACANLANLLLARGTSRRRELALRLALGASRPRLVRQLFTESVLLAALGAGAGLLLATWLLDLLTANLIPTWAEVQEMSLRVDWQVAGFSVALALATAVAFGLVPAWRATRLDLTSEFQGGTRALGGGRSRLSRALMVAQVALSLVLLVIAGMLGRTVHNLRAVDIGFNRERLLLFSLSGVSGGYTEGPQLADFYRRAADRIANVGGVTGVTYSSAAVLSQDGGGTISFQRVGGGPESASPAEVRWNQVETTFFKVHEMAFLVGRGFTAVDAAAGPAEVVVNQAFARKYFSGETPVGHHIQVKRRRIQREAEIVGVVRDFRQKDLRSEASPMLYTPVAQWPVREANFAVRTLGPSETVATAIRQTVAELDPNVPVAQLRTQTDQIEWTVAEERMMARLATFLGIAAVVLASVGLYGLLAYGVARRTSEIGLRIALGALPRRVLTMILRESLGLIALGVILGVGGALAAVRLLTHMLYGLSPADVPTYGAATLLLIAVGLLAAFLPARRAAKIDPVVALRAE